MNKLKIGFTPDGKIKKTFEINIDENKSINDIKDLILENLSEENSPRNFNNVDLICRNIILDKDNLIEFYRLSSDDEIWAGRLEYLLTDDDVIVELDLIGWMPHLVHVVMKKWDPISRITSMIERFIGEPGRIDIWNAHDGDRLEDTAIIGEIDWRGGYTKIIISWCEDMGLTFEQCCYLHDKDLIEKYEFMYDWKKIYYIFVEFSKVFKHSKAHFDENFWPCLLDDSRLDEILPVMPESIRNSKFFCFLFVANRILPIFKDHWIRECQKMDDDEYFKRSVNELFPVLYAILVASILEYFDNSQPNNSNKSMRDILSAASCWEFDMDKKWFLDYFLLLPRTDYMDENMQFIQRDWFTNIVIFRRQDSMVRAFPIQRNAKTILQAKKAISWHTGIPLDELFPLWSETNEQPKDEDCLDERNYKFEVICRLDSIEMIKQVGQGGYGTVHLIEDVVTKEKYALKIFDENHYREIIIFNRIHRYNFAQLSRGLYRNDDNTICIAMKYLSGGSLQSYLQERNRLPEEEIARISRNLLQQIDEIHSKKIIHRDIKTDNVVFDENHEPHLIDFGLSKDYEKSQSKMLVKYSPGNFYYKAPEIYFEEPYSTKIDIWSFGVMVIEMLTGKKPFPDITSHYEMAMRVRETGKVQFEANFEISEEMKEFIDLSMKPDPNERATAKELLKILLSCFT